MVAAFDTELFGHWWHEGPLWLERVLRALPAGIRVGTLTDAITDGFVGDAVDLPPGSWGSGKDWQVWAGEQVSDLVQLNAEVVDTALATVDKALDQAAVDRVEGAADTVADQILRETLLTVSSDWPFMVSKDSAAEYARYRAHLHAHATREIAGALASSRRARPAAGRRLEPRRRLLAFLDVKAASPMSPLGERACLRATRRLRTRVHARSRTGAIRDEGPDGVVGVPAGRDRRTRQARAPPGDRTRRRPATRWWCSAADPPTPTPARTRRPTRSPRARPGGRRRAGPARFGFGTDMMAWTLAMGHAMVRASA